MRVRASSASAVMVSLLVNDVFAAVHGRHEMFHRKRTEMDVTVTDEVVETKTEVIYVTVEWPGGETLGVEYPSDMPTPAASTTSPGAAIPSYTVSSAGSSVTDTFPPAIQDPATTSTPPAVVPTKDPAKTSTPPAVVPTTMATVVVAAASTHTAAAPAPASTSPVSNSKTVTTSGSTDSSKKRGVAFNDAFVTDYFTGGSSEVSWCYNWGQTGPGTAAGLEYIPTLWNNDPSRTGSWASAASSAIASGSGHLFSFNEPDYSGQANMDIDTAVSAYKQFIDPFAGQAKLGAPAVTNGGGPMGLQYMANFIGNCSGCTIDFVNIHWYDSATNFAYFKGHVQDAHTMSGGLPVWITEFAASGSEDEQNAFLEVVLPWLDAQPYVERYAYFMASEGVLLSGNGLSTLGATFTDYVSSSISPLIADA
jgi:hypothetical protein